MPTAVVAWSSQLNKHPRLREAKMEASTKAKDGSLPPTGERSTLARYLEKLDFQPAESRAPKTIITKAHYLTGYEIFLFSDLTREWAKIEEGTGKEVPLTTEVMATFFSQEGQAQGRKRRQGHRRRRVVKRP